MGAERAHAACRGDTFCQQGVGVDRTSALGPAPFVCAAVSETVCRVATVPPSLECPVLSGSGLVLCV